MERLTKGRDDGKPGRIIKFDAHPRPFHCYTTVCSDPESESREVSYEFEEVADGSETSGAPLRFKMELSIDTWQAANREALGATESAVVAELMRDLGEPEKNAARCFLAWHRALGSDRPPKLTPFEIEDGVLVMWRDVARDGESSDMPFKHDGELWIALDQYCPNPACDCDEACLSFWVAEGRDFEERVSATFPFARHWAIEEVYGCSKTAGKRVVESWQAVYPHFAEVSPKRYECVRRLYAAGGRGVAEAPTRRIAAATPRPNDPCPCGSGKKHKRCCGR